MTFDIVKKSLFWHKNINNYKTTVDKEYIFGTYLGPTMTLLITKFETHRLNRMEDIQSQTRQAILASFSVDTPIYCCEIDVSFWTDVQ